MTTGSNGVIASPLGARVEMHTNDPPLSVATSVQPIIPRLREQ